MKSLTDILDFDLDLEQRFWGFMSSSNPVPNPSNQNPLIKVGKFADINIQKAIDDVASRLSQNDKGAFVAYTDFNNTVSVAAIHRIGDHFSVEAAAIYSIPDKKLSGVAELVGKW